MVGLVFYEIGYFGQFGGKAGLLGFLLGKRKGLWILKGLGWCIGY